jgi:hypothetical protein
MARPPKSPEERPALVFHAEVRLYASEPELLAYFSQFKPGQYATAIKRLARVALQGGDHALLGTLSHSLAASAMDVDDDLDDFVG